MNGLLYSSAVSLAGMIRKRRVSAEELAAMALSRIEEVNSKLNAVVQIADERAMYEARAADRALVNSAAYGASKGGVVALSRTTAIEYCTKNIRVNCINPGSIATDMVLNLSPEFKETVLTATPRRKFAEPEEVAQAALFLATDESAHIIGQSLVIDGGLEADSHLGTCG